MLVKFKVILMLLCFAGIAYCRSAKDFGVGTLGQSQRNQPRVVNARRNCWSKIDSMFDQVGIEYPAKIFLRAFKMERLFELWAFSPADTKYVWLKTYNFTSYSGNLGPKRRHGDGQIPEGFYKIDEEDDFNPQSAFHLSLLIDYPNKSDRIFGDSTNPGNEIRIHGSNVTIGCIPIGNSNIEELYIIAMDSKDAGNNIDVHIFPCAFGDSSCAQVINAIAASDSSLDEFWKNLRQGYEYFENNGRLPKITVDDNGKYIFK